MLERAMITSEDRQIMAADLDLNRFTPAAVPWIGRHGTPWIGRHGTPWIGRHGFAAVPLKPMEEIERNALVRALEKWNGNRTRAAEELGLSRRTVLNKIKHYGL